MEQQKEIITDLNISGMGINNHLVQTTYNICKKNSMSKRKWTLKRRRRGFTWTLEIRRNSSGGDDFRYLTLLRPRVCTFRYVLSVMDFDYWSSSTNPFFWWKILGSFLIVWTFVICVVVFSTESQYRKSLPPSLIGCLLL